MSADGRGDTKDRGRTVSPSASARSSSGPSADVAGARLLLLGEHERGAAGRRQQAKRVEAILLVGLAEERAGDRDHARPRPVVRDAGEHREAVGGRDVDLGLLLGHGRRVDDLEERRRDERRHERHDDHHREERGRDDAEIEPDVEHDQLHQPARVHEDSERRRLAPAKSGEARRDRAAAELADARDENHHAADDPRVQRVEEPDLRAKAAVGEEERQEQHDDQVFELVGEELREMILLRHDRAEDERAEERVDADDLGDPTRHQQEEQRTGDEILTEAFLVRAPRREPLDERTHAAQHEHDVGDREEGGPRAFRHVRHADERDHTGEDAPGGDVVDGGTRDRDRADLRSEQAPFDEDPRQHGKRGDAHRRAHEEREREEGDARRCELAVQVMGEPRTEGEGHDDAGVADRDRGVAASPQEARVELEADQEHEKDEAELAEQPEERHARRGKQRLRSLRGEPPEQRRSERDAGHDLRDDHRLADAPGSEPYRTRRRDDQDRLNDEERKGAVNQRSKHAAARRLADGRRAGNRPVRGWRPRSHHHWAPARRIRCPTASSCAAHASTISRTSTSRFRARSWW
jgi:hypothetical protein